MSVEWDEELARQLFQNLGGSLAAWSVDFWTFFQMGKSEHDRADAEHAARLEAEAERDALAEKVEGIRELVALFGHTAVYDLKGDILAILSDEEGR